MSALSLREQISLIVFSAADSRHLRTRDACACSVTSGTGFTAIPPGGSVRQTGHRRPCSRRPRVRLSALRLLHRAAWIDVHVMTLHTAKLKTAGFRIVQISDLHCDRTAFERGARSSGSSTVSSRTSSWPRATTSTIPPGLPRLRRCASRLEAPLGKFAVTGNFEVCHWPAPRRARGQQLSRLDQETVVVTKGRGRHRASPAWATSVPMPRATPSRVFRRPIRRLSLPHAGPDRGRQRLRRRSVPLRAHARRAGGPALVRGLDHVLEIRQEVRVRPAPGRRHDALRQPRPRHGASPAPQMRFLARPEIAVFRHPPGVQR